MGEAVVTCLIVGYSTSVYLDRRRYIMINSGRVIQVHGA